MRTATILRGHALQRLRELPDGSVHACITSPPYYGLRDYKTDGQVWGGDPACQHRWLARTVTRRSKNGDGLAAWSAAHARGGGHSQAQAQAITLETGTCITCGAWHGELGQEETPELYVAHLVEIFREVWRVLHPTGTLWLNIGDSRARNGGSGGPGASAQVGNTRSGEQRRMSRVVGNLKPKDLIGIPWMLAFALRDDGWYLRSAITWAKGISFVPGYSGSCMPESVDDRPTDGSEMVFLLAKGEGYFCDMFAVRERGTIPAGTLAAKGSGTREGNRRQAFTRSDDHRVSEHEPASGRADGYALYDGYRNLRNVWAIGTSPYDGEFCTACGRLYDGAMRSLLRITGEGESRTMACLCGRTDAWVSHFATFPETLVEPCVLAGTSAGGCCPRCLNPRERVFELKNGARVQVDWRWTCFCQVGPPMPCTVLDPFTGRGTTAIVALRHDRRFVGVELNPDYARMAVACISADGPLLNNALVVEAESPAVDAEKQVVPNIVGSVECE
jgi:DNA modification methylase